MHCYVDMFLYEGHYAFEDVPYIFRAVQNIKLHHCHTYNCSKDFFVECCFSVQHGGLSL